eukprot:5851262-Pleurochrysis_carterae.AAC.1
MSTKYPVVQSYCVTNSVPVKMSRCACAAASLLLLPLLLIILALALPPSPCDTTLQIGKLSDGAGTRPGALSAHTVKGQSRRQQTSSAATAIWIQEPDDASPKKQQMGDTLAESTCKPPDRLRLVVGIITAPSHFDRRVWIRQKLRVSEAACRGVRVLFILGSRNHMTRSQQLAVRQEHQAHGDMLFVLVRSSPRKAAAPSREERT